MQHSNQDGNRGGSYRESHGDRNATNEKNYSNQGGGWEDDRSGHERGGYGRGRNYHHDNSDGRSGRFGSEMKKTASEINEIKKTTKKGRKQVSKGRSSPKPRSRSSR